MIQALVRKGRVVPAELPAPLVSAGAVLVKTVSSCISAGTELTELAKTGKGVIRRALDQPAAAWKFVNAVRVGGLSSAVDRVTGARELGSPLGYSASGIVLAAGEGVEDLRQGDRVAVAGVGIANHAEYIEAPRAMAVRLPDGADFPAASTVALGAIAMQAVRRAGLAVGEFGVVYGAGTIGQLVVQILVAAGVRVIAVDIDEGRLATAAAAGAELCVNPRERALEAAVRDLTGGNGADAVLYCATATDPRSLSACASAARRKGRLVLVGMWSGEIAREDIYAKELDVLVSTSYGPGRYDPRYEKNGVDYPYAYVRWTEGRNMEEYLRLIAAKKVHVDRLIEASFPIARVEEAFETLRSARPRPLFVVLEYGDELAAADYAPLRAPRRVENGAARKASALTGRIRVGVIGAGRFATGMHLPNLASLPALYQIRAMCTRTGATAMAAARAFDAAYATSDYHEVLSDPDVDLVMICAPAPLHARLALDSLHAGKHTFVEKPLCTTAADLALIEEYVEGTARDRHAPSLSVGFNRRFSPYAREVKRRVSSRVTPLFIRYRMNAGYVAPDDPVYGVEGGRIVGEACHIIDLASFLTGAPVRAYGSASLAPRTESFHASDNMAMTLEYEDGSLAEISYFSLGSKELHKEMLEVHFDRSSIVVDDYRCIRGHGVKVAALSSPTPEKGHREELEQLAASIREGRWLIPWESVRETTELTFALSGMAVAPEAGVEAGPAQEARSAG